jgi:hypothetical protein
MTYLKRGLIAIFPFALGACAYMPQVNSDRRVEVNEIVAVVECEIVAAFRAIPLTIGKWDVKSSLDLTLVQQADANGNIAWAIPISNVLTPSLGFAHQTTTIAHLDFVTQVRKAMAGPAKSCRPALDPSQTGLGLAAWMQSTFTIGSERHGGLSYTREFEITASAGTKFGFAFRVPVTGEIGLSGKRIDTNRLTVTVSPHVDSSPTEVIIVEDKTGERRVIKGGSSRYQQILTNPIGNQNLLRQSPIRTQPGSTLQVR